MAGGTAYSWLLQQPGLVSQWALCPLREMRGCEASECSPIEHVCVYMCAAVLTGQQTNSCLISPDQTAVEKRKRDFVRHVFFHACVLDLVHVKSAVLLFIPYGATLEKRYDVLRGSLGCAHTRTIYLPPLHLSFIPVHLVSVFSVFCFTWMRSASAPAPGECLGIHVREEHLQIGCN